MSKADSEEKDKYKEDYEKAEAYKKALNVLAGIGGRIIL